MDYASIIHFADEILSRKDPYNHHGENVCTLSLKIALFMETNIDHELLAYSARLHDVGKILLDDVLLNYPRRLTTAEYARVKSHVELGHSLLQSIGAHPDICEAVDCHHEHWDGSGYPHGLKGEQIPMFARILSIADTWDSMTNNRAYRKAMPPDVALMEMNKVSNWFDPKLYTIFLRILRESHDGK